VNINAAEVELLVQPVAGAKLLADAVAVIVPPVAEIATVVVEEVYKESVPPRETVALWFVEVVNE